MFDIDKWQEIFSTIRQNKLRTFLTGFSVAWGILVLIILMGSGTGLENGFQKEFEKDAQNAMWLYPGMTSLPFNGLLAGREIQFKNGDHDILPKIFDEIKDISAEMYVQGGKAVFKKNTGRYSLKAVHPAHKKIEFRKMIEGRFVNEKDNRDERKVASIGKTAKDELFEDENPIGKYIRIDKTPYKVVGYFEEDLGQNSAGRIYIPISTAQKIYGANDKIDELMFTVQDASYEESIELAWNIRKRVAKLHNFDVMDPRALYIQNNLENFKMFTKIFGFLRIFIWAISILTLISGIIGVGNIMMVIVKERTFEIGIRKAIGASPLSVMGLIMQESIFITSIAGFFGLVAGIGILEFYNSGAWIIALNKFGIMKGFTMDQINVFNNPSVDMGLMVKATVALVICGCIAGFIPARRAARIKPIEALRKE